MLWRAEEEREMSRSAKKESEKRARKVQERDKRTRKIKERGSAKANARNLRPKKEREDFRPGAQKRKREG
jgi:hypothetical protein